MRGDSRLMEASPARSRTHTNTHTHKRSTRSNICNDSRKLDVDKTHCPLVPDFLSVPKNFPGYFQNLIRIHSPVPVFDAISVVKRDGCERVVRWGIQHKEVRGLISGPVMLRVWRGPSRDFGPLF
ncbi:hypothetical protein BgiBS90_023432 [Biomphalaria glabrata]|nr:hypothetical protein BgiBS90_023432 [Biomphalaria glabrata]